MAENKKMRVYFVTASDKRNYVRSADEQIMKNKIIKG